MPKFVTVGYGDQKGYEQTPKPVRDKAHRHDADLVAAGAVMGVAGKPVQVRNTEDGGVETSEGAYMNSALPIAGFTVVEASSLEEAIKMAAQQPCAVAHGVVEVWPLVAPEDK